MGEIFWTEHRVETLRRLVAEGMTAQEVADRLGSSRKAVLSASQRRGISGWSKASTQKGATIPDDFVALQATMKHRELAAHYGVSTSTIVNWQGIKGIRRPEDYRNKKRGPRARKFGFTYTPTPVTPPTETGPLADAARYLRQQGYANVYRRSRDEWQVGSRPMSEKDMLARVEEIKARRARMMGVA